MQNSGSTHGAPFGSVIGAHFVRHTDNTGRHEVKGSCTAMRSRATGNAGRSTEVIKIERDVRCTLLEKPHSDVVRRGVISAPGARAVSAWLPGRTELRIGGQEG